MCATGHHQEGRYKEGQGKEKKSKRNQYKWKTHIQSNMDDRGFSGWNMEEKQHYASAVFCVNSLDIKENNTRRHTVLVTALNTDHTYKRYLGKRAAVGQSSC
jgi:hypothetical protein